MPEETAAPFISMWKTQVARGPVMALASVGAIQMRGFFTMLPIWEGDKIFFKLLNEEHPWFSLKLVYEGDVLRQAVLDGERVV